MSDFINRTTLEFVRSVNDPDYPDPPWLEVPPGSPNRSVIDSVPQKYQKISGDVVSEMNASEKSAVDAAEAAALVAENRAASVARADENTGEGFELRQLVELFNKRDNYLVNRIDELQSALVALQSSGGNAGTRLDALPTSYLPTSTRNRAQAVQEYKDGINAGEADS